MRALLAAVFAAVFAVALAGSAVAREKLVTRASPHTAKATMDKIVAALAAKDIKPLARIDHAAAAKANGLELKPTEVVLFGSPQLGTVLMQASRTAAIDLPMKMLVWEDDKGKTWIGYASPQTLKTRHGIKGKAQGEALKAIGAVLDGLASQATR